MIEMNVGKVPRPGPARRREGRGWHYFTEEERRVGDLDAMRNPAVEALARRCIVDYDGDRPGAAEIAAALAAHLHEALHEL
eukprot:COSAG02_NODE_1531_length_12086_cov_22.388588_6_plen_81_part_00